MEKPGLIDPLAADALLSGLLGAVIELVETSDVWLIESIASDAEPRFARIVTLGEDIVALGRAGQAVLRSQEPEQ